jgi:tetratricopeptide (TPR) repeat protein
MGVGRLQTCKATSVPHISDKIQADKALTHTTLGPRNPARLSFRERAPCKTRPHRWSRGWLVALLVLGYLCPLQAQEREGDEAWSQGRFQDAQRAYRQLLESNPRAIRANLRMGVMLSWQGKLDSSLVFLARARAADPVDPEIRLIEARVLAWNNQHTAALARYDSLIVANLRLREARLGRNQTLAWAGRLTDARRGYRRILDADSTDRDARLGYAQVSAWMGDLATAEHEYRALLVKQPRDVEARVGLGYVYFWEGREAAAGRQARYALDIDSTHKAGRELRRQTRESTRPSLETSANWSNDSDHNTNFWQTAGASTSLGGGVRLFGSVDALEASDPLRDATRVGGEAGLTLALGRFQVTAAGGARRLTPEITPPRTAETYRGRLSYRPSSRLGLSLGYARVPFDEIASLMEQRLDMELLEGGVDARLSAGLTMFGGGGALWLNDGNERTSASLGLTQKIHRRFFVGAFARTLSYERRGMGYFSPDRFSVLEGNAGYKLEGRTWVGGLSGGLGAQQVGSDGAAQTEWHIEGRLGPRWGSGNRVEVFGLVTNSAVSSTTGAFQYRSAGLTVRLGL